VAVGLRGHIVYSDDSGIEWIQASVPVSCDLTAVYFVNGKTGWAVGHQGVVLVSRDGGATWEKLLDGREAGRIMVDYVEEKLAKREPSDADTAWRQEARQIVDEGIDKPFLDVWFADEENGYVVGAFNMIFKTGDGGKSWQPLFDRTNNPHRLHFYAIRRFGQTIYIAGESGLLLKSQYGSDDFAPVPVPYNGSLFGLLATRGSLLAFGLRGNLFRSEDGGGHWARIETGESSALVGGAVGPDDRITIVAQDGMLLMSRDDGQHFTLSGSKKPMALSGVVEALSGHLVVVGFNGVRQVELTESRQ
jgi:photosystem II stability/assembly factor-like uncharacterized protein